MLTGIVNQESLSQLLQSIAQRRKQGDLEITLAESVVKISFIQGKIVEFQDGSGVPTQEVYLLLKRAGIFKADATEFAGTGYTALLKHTEENWGGQGNALDTLKSAVKKRLLDKLHPFEIESTVPWGFRVGGVDVDRAIATGTSVSQLLLDWSEVDTVLEKFEQKFRPEMVISRSKEFNGSTGTDESLLLANLEGPSSIAALEDHAILDSHAFRQALLNLFECGAVVQQSEAIPQPPPEPKAPEIVVTAPAPEPPKAVKPKKIKKPKPARESTSDIVPHVLALVMLISAIVLPFFFWQEAFTQF